MLHYHCMVMQLEKSALLDLTAISSHIDQNEHRQKGFRSQLQLVIFDILMKRPKPTIIVL